MRLLIFCTILLFVSCNTPKQIAYLRTGEVNCVKYDVSTITVNSIGRAADASTATYFSEKNALENILFKGIPNCNQQSAMIPNEDNFLEKHKAEYDLFINNDYVRYVISSDAVNTNNTNGVYIQQREITIDIRALRKYMEEKKWIRKFGI